MKKIRLLSLKLESFRGLANYELCPDGKNTVVTGANGTGKSTLAAAFLWLLTGKDDQGRADYNIFPLGPDGRRLSGCTPTVTAVLEVEGEQLVLQRSLAEKWTKRRGAAEAEYAGDESRFVVDEVPVSAGEYARRVEQLTAGDMLPLLTSAAWFSERTKDYKERRRLLLERFGGVSAGEVFDACPELQPLRQEMGRHSVEEYSRICADRRKRYKEELAALPARIDENRKQLVPDLDTAALRTRRGELNVEIAKLRYRIEHTDTSSEGQRIQDQLAALEEQLSLVPIKRRAMEQAENAGWDARHAKQLAAAMQEKAAAEFELRKTELELDAACKRLEDTVARRDELRVQWTDAAGEQTEISETCPTCGQLLPPEQLQAARDAWNTQKAQRLAEIAQKGKQAAQEAQELEALAEKLQIARQAAGQRLESQRQALAALESETPPAADSRLLDKLAAQEQDLLQKRQALTAQLADLDSQAQAAKEQLSARLQELQQQSDQLTAQLARQQQNETLAARIRELEGQQRAAMEGLEQADRGLALCQDFTQRMVSMLTERVNSHFSTVRFRLFEEQKNGGLREVCEATVEGVPYGALNTAGRMQANLEIVAAFSTACGCTLPLFVDGRESVTRLAVPDWMQIINLKVKPGAALGEK